MHEFYDTPESVNTVQTEYSVQPLGVEEDFSHRGKESETEFDEQADESNYDEQVDFYGSSMEEFSGERSDGNLIWHKQEAALASGHSENIEMVTGIKEEASHLGFSATDKPTLSVRQEFHHKSQRDRDMSMHPGPAQGWVCGKNEASSHVT